MDAFHLREPVSALSHGLGMVLALAATWMLMSRLQSNRSSEGIYHRGKVITLFLFGACLTFCYGASGIFHALPIPPGSGNVFHRLDHVGIYLLIAGTYTPVAWSMMRGGWRSGTLTIVWLFAMICAVRVWLGGLLPIWISTVIYMTMGWAALGCYRDLMSRHSQRILYPLPLGGIFYSMGAIINLSGWPAIAPGVFGAHELFHFFVLAGSGWHFYFMHEVVIFAENPANSQATSLKFSSSPIPVPKLLRRKRERLNQVNREQP